MADIVIRGMEMPLRCINCPFEMFIHGENRCRANFGKRIEFEIGNDRGTNCPLVPLPGGHGRLGDLDALQDEFKKFHDGKRSMLIDTAPTIVPAEGSEADG